MQISKRLNVLVYSGKPNEIIIYYESIANQLQAKEALSNPFAMPLSLYGVCLLHAMLYPQSRAKPSSKSHGPAHVHCLSCPAVLIWATVLYSMEPETER